MQKGKFYFISDEFYRKYDTERKLMQNKETINGKSIGRPCFYAFPDKKTKRFFGVYLFHPKSKSTKILLIKNTTSNRKKDK